MNSPSNAAFNSETLDAVRRILTPRDFPQYSQLDPHWEFEPGTERRMCGIVCTKAVLDFYSPDGLSPSIHEIVAQVKQGNDQKPNGISHAVEVNVLKSQGLVAWRRNWEAPSSDPSWLVENESYDTEQVDAIKQQLAAEGSSEDVLSASLMSIKESLANNNPVIASVRPYFGDNAADHQIVITEISKDGQYIVVMDPIQQPGTEIRTETTERFARYFNRKAIFSRQV